MDLRAFGSSGYHPLKELMRAMVLRAIDDYRTKGEFFDEAKEYLEDEDEDYILSFKYICQHLDIDADKTRNMIFKGQKKISTRRRAA